MALAASAAIPVLAAHTRWLGPAQGQRLASEPDGPRETWHVYKDGETVWGTQHVRVESLPEGRRSFVIRTRMLTELLGTKQEMTTQSEVLVGPDLAPLRLITETVQMSGASRIEGESTTTGFVVTARTGDETATSTISVNDELGLIADAALEEWLRRLPPTTTTSRVRLLASASGSVYEAAVALVERGDGGSVWRLQADGAIGAITIRLDADGAITEQMHRFPPLRIVRHADASGLPLVHRRFGDAELLVFPVDRELPPLRRVATLTVQVTWKDIDPDSFHLEDSRQSARSMTTDEQGRTTAVVVLRRAAESKTDCMRPVEGADLAGFLGETDFIKPHDPEIVRTAKEILDGVKSAGDAIETSADAASGAGNTAASVGRSGSARAATQAICAWVAEFIEPAMVAETLSGPEVLRRRVGKCTEYSTLFASLARSAGIPTRIVLGQRLFPGKSGMHWGGHMWNEVWVGEWIPVDASAAEVGGSPALLKLLHSDSVMGTQAIRWMLTESLGISVIEVTTTREGQGAVGDPNIVDGLHDGVWANTSRGIRFQLPDESWRVEDQSTPGTLLLRIRPSEDKDPGASAMIHFTSFDVNGGISPRVVGQARLNGHRASLASLEVRQDEPTTVAGAPAHRTSFRGVPKDAPPLMVTELIWSKNGTGCLVNLIAAEPLHEQWLPSLERIAATFEFLPPGDSE